MHTYISISVFAWGSDSAIRSICRVANNDLRQFELNKNNKQARNEPKQCGKLGNRNENKSNEQKKNTQLNVMGVKRSRRALSSSKYTALTTLSAAFPTKSKNPTQTAIQNIYIC